MTFSFFFPKIFLPPFLIYLGFGGSFFYFFFLEKFGENVLVESLFTPWPLLKMGENPVFVFFYFKRRALFNNVNISIKGVLYHFCLGPAFLGGLIP